MTQQVISEKQLEKIRADHAKGHTIPQLAARYQISEKSLAAIIPAPKRRRYLPDDQVLALRRKAAEGVSDEDLAETYGISRNCAAQIRSGRRRKNVGGPLTIERPAPNGARCGRARLTPKQVKAIIKGYNPEKTTIRALAEKYSVGESTVSAILHRRSWPAVWEEIDAENTEA